MCYEGTTLLREKHGTLRPTRDHIILFCSVLEVRYTLPNSDYVYETLNFSALVGFGVLSP